MVSFTADRNRLFTTATVLAVCSMAVAPWRGGSGLAGEPVVAPGEPVTREVPK
jgi:hypothetical protein